MEKNLQKLIEKLYKIGLSLVDYENGMFSIKRRDIANPLMFFNVNEEYTGTVKVKSININLYTPEQVWKSLGYVETFFVMTQEN